MTTSRLPNEVGKGSSSSSYLIITDDDIMFFITKQVRLIMPVGGFIFVRGKTNKMVSQETPAANLYNIYVSFPAYPPLQGTLQDIMD